MPRSNVTLHEMQQRTCDAKFLPRRHYRLPFVVPLLCGLILLLSVPLASYAQDAPAPENALNLSPTDTESSTFAESESLGASESMNPSSSVSRLQSLSAAITDSAQLTNTATQEATETPLSSSTATSSSSLTDPETETMAPTATRTMMKTLTTTPTITPPPTPTKPHTITKTITVTVTPPPTPTATSSATQVFQLEMKTAPTSLSLVHGSFAAEATFSGILTQLLPGYEEPVPVPDVFIELFIHGLPKDSYSFTNGRTRTKADGSFELSNFTISACPPRTFTGGNISVRLVGYGNDEITAASVPFTFEAQKDIILLHNHTPFPPDHSIVVGRPIPPLELELVDSCGNSLGRDALGSNVTIEEVICDDASSPQFDNASCVLAGLSSPPAHDASTPGKQHYLQGTLSLSFTPRPAPKMIAEFSDLQVAGYTKQHRREVVLRATAKLKHLQTVAVAVYKLDPHETGMNVSVPVRIELNSLEKETGRLMPPRLRATTDSGVVVPVVSAEEVGSGGAVVSLTCDVSAFKTGRNVSLEDFIVTSSVQSSVAPLGFQRMLTFDEYTLLEHGKDTDEQPAVLPVVSQEEIANLRPDMIGRELVVQKTLAPNNLDPLQQLQNASKDKEKPSKGLYFLRVQQDTDVVRYVSSRSTKLPSTTSSPSSGMTADDGDLALDQTVRYSFQLRLFIGPKENYRTFHREEITLRIKDPSAIFEPIYRPGPADFKFIVEGKTVPQITLVRRILSLAGLNGGALGRLSAAALAADCNADLPQPLDYILHPLQFAVGTTTIKYFIGAVLGNFALIVGVALVHLGIATARPNADRMRFPHFTLIFVRSLYPGTTISAMMILAHSTQEDLAPLLLALVAIVLFALAFPVAIFMTSVLMSGLWQQHKYGSDDDEEEVGIIRRITTPVGFYTYAHPDNWRYRGTHNKYRGPMRAYAGFDICYALLLCAASLFKLDACSTRGAYIFWLSSVHCATLVFLRPFSMPVLNYYHASLDVAQIVALLVYVDPASSSMNPRIVFDNALFAAVIVEVLLSMNGARRIVSKSVRYLLREKRRKRQKVLTSGLDSAGYRWEGDDEGSDEDKEMEMEQGGGVRGGIVNEMGYVPSRSGSSSGRTPARTPLPEHHGRGAIVDGAKPTKADKMVRNEDLVVVNHNAIVQQQQQQQQQQQLPPKNSPPPPPVLDPQTLWRRKLIHHHLHGSRPPTDADLGLTQPLMSDTDRSSLEDGGGRGHGDRDNSVQFVELPSGTADRSSAQLLYLQAVDREERIQHSSAMDISRSPTWMASTVDAGLYHGRHHSPPVGGEPSTTIVDSILADHDVDAQRRLFELLSPPCRRNQQSRVVEENGVAGDGPKRISAAGPAASSQAGRHPTTIRKKLPLEWELSQL